MKFIKYSVGRNTLFHIQITKAACDQMFNHKKSKYVDAKWANPPSYRYLLLTVPKRLWFLNVICYIRVHMVSRFLPPWITVAHTASCFSFVIWNREKGKIDVIAVFNQGSWTTTCLRNSSWFGLPCVPLVNIYQCSCVCIFSSLVLRLSGISFWSWSVFLLLSQ